MHDPLWETPFERPGIVPRLYNRQYQLHLYPNNIGAVADVDASITKEKPPSGDYAGSGMHTNKFCFFFIFSVVLSHTHTWLPLFSLLSLGLFSIILAQRVLVVQRPSNQEQTTNQRTQDKEVAHQKQQQIINHQVYNICHGMV